MSNILAIDASTKRTGLATMVDGVLKYDVISSAAAAPEKRIGIMRDGIIKFIKENNIDTVVMEEVRPDGMNNHTGKLLTWLQGCIVVAIYEYDKNINVEFIGPSSWRSALGLQGYRIQRAEQKKRDIEYANKTYGLNLTQDQDDEADAIGILSARLRGLQSETKPAKLGPIGSDESAFFFLFHPLGSTNSKG